MLFGGGPKPKIAFVFFNTAFAGASASGDQAGSTAQRCFICALSASHGRVGERAGHLLLDALHSAGANTKLTGDLVDARHSLTD